MNGGQIDDITQRISRGAAVVLEFVNDQLEMLDNGLELADMDTYRNVRLEYGRAVGLTDYYFSTSMLTACRVFHEGDVNEARVLLEEAKAGLEANII